MRKAPPPQRALGFLTSAGFAVCFFVLPLVGNCKGGQLVQAGLDDRATSDGRTIGLLLLGALVAVVAAGVLHAVGVARAAGVAAFAGAGFLAATYFKSGIGISDVRHGGYALLALATAAAGAGLLPAPSGGAPPRPISGCPSCGAPLAAMNQTDRFCTSCGAVLARPEQSQ